MNRLIEIKFCIHIIIDKIYVGIVNLHFRKFATELWPLIDVRINFLFNILRMNGQNLTKFYIHIIDKCKSSLFPILKFYLLVVNMFMEKGYYCALYIEYC